MLFMAKNDIFANFPFFHFPNELKKRKNETYLWAFSIFPLFRFKRKTKKQKVEIYSIVFSIFLCLTKIGKIVNVSIFCNVFLDILVN